MTPPPLEFGSFQMWATLHEWWRSVLQRASQATPASPPPADSPRNALREELRRRLEERTTLQQTAASYREFGYDDLAGRVHGELVSADRRIVEIRLLLRRKPGAFGRESRD